MKSIFGGLLLSALVVAMAAVAAKSTEPEAVEIHEEAIEEVQLSQLPAEEQEFVEKGFALNLVF